jgi:type I restriction enzyme S subunit
MIKPWAKIPKGWSVFYLDKVAERGSGHTPERDNPEYWNGGIKWVSLADSDKLDRLFLKETAYEISQAGVDNSSAELHPAGSVLISRDAGVGKSSIMAVPMAVSQHFIVWRCGPKIDARYLYYILQGEKSFFERIAVGSTIKTIGLGIFKNLLVHLPPIEQQSKAAAILTSWDMALETLDALIAARERRYSATLEALLKRHAGNRCKILEVTRETGPRNRTENISRVLSVTNAHGFVLPEDYFDKQVASSDVTGYKIVRRGEYAYNPSRINVGSIARLEQWEEGIVSPIYVVFALNHRVEADYFHHWLNSHEARSRIRRSAQGSVRDSVNYDDFSSIKLPLPDRSKQKAIADCLNAMQAELTLQRDQRAALDQQKRGLMQQLLTGKRRVSA